MDDFQHTRGGFLFLLDLLTGHAPPRTRPSPCPLPATRGEGGRRPGEGRFMERRLRRGLDAREVQPKVPEVVVLTKDDLAVASRHRVPKHVTVPAPFQYRDRHP